MKYGSFDSTHVYSTDNESVNSPYFPGDLTELIENMKLSNDWTNGSLFAKILMSSSQKHVVLTVLHEGTEINSFQSNDSVTIEIIEGELMFQSKEKHVILQKGQYLTVHDKIRYCLTTAEDTAFLLTVAGSNSGEEEKLNKQN